MSSPLITLKVNSGIHTPGQPYISQRLLDSDAQNEKEDRICEYAPQETATPIIFTDERFVTDLMQKLDSNAVCSPLSIALILSLLQLASGGKARYQIMSALRKDTTIEELQSINSLFNTDIISLANLMIINKAFKINKQFVQEVSTIANIQNVDFTQKAEVVANANAYIEDQTRGLISNVIQPDQIKVNTIMILINSIYFKAKWEKSFNEKMTVDQLFNQTKSIKMMNITNYFPYGENDYCQMLELPYTGREFFMGFILRKNLDADYVLPLMNNCRVKVSIPKFTHRSKIDLIPCMKKLGIIDLFDGASPLPGISNEVKVDGLSHEAVIIVGEDGTEAAAVTVASVKKECLMREPKCEIFNADRTFDYYIRHKSLIIIFKGSFSG